MQHRISNWLAQLPVFSNPVEQQQAPALQVFYLMVGIGATVWIPLPFVIGSTPLGLIIGVVAALTCTLACIVSIYLLRSGRFRMAISFSAAMISLSVALTMLPWGLSTGMGMIFAFTMTILLAGLLGSPRSLIITSTGCILFVVSAALSELFGWGLVGFAPLRGSPIIMVVGTFTLVTLILMAVLLRFGMSMRQTLQEALVRQEELTLLKASLEHQVAERTNALHTALQEATHREQYLHETLSDLQTSRDTIRELSVPVIPLMSGVLLLPLIGAIDSVRADTLMSMVLDATERKHAKVVIFDITGVPLVDSHVAQVLLKAASAIRLLGGQVFLVGTRPEVAQTLVSLNIQLDTLTNYADLQSALVALQP